MPSRLLLWTAFAATVALMAGNLAAQTGGPDAFGYSYADESATGGPTYSFQDISTTGTQLTLSGDDNGTDLSLSQSFSFYGVSTSTISVTTNGYISLTSGDGGPDFSNDGSIPTTPSSGNTSDGRIYAYHDDLEVPTGGAVYHEFFATSPVNNIGGSTEPCTIIMWDNISRLSAGDSFDMNVILFHNTGEVRYQYANLGSVDGGSATIAIQNGGATIGLAYSINTSGSVTNSRAISFFLPPATPAITTTAPTNAPVGSAYTYTVAATGNPAPTFTITPDPATQGSGWLTWDGTDTLSGTPVAGDVGSYGPFTITATNSAGTDTEQFTIVVALPAPEIDILDPGSNSVASGSTLDVFGTVAGMSTTGTFTIDNSAGTDDLNLTGTPDLIAQSGATNCTLTITQPTVNPIGAGNSDTFGLDVQPTAAGAWSVTITIANDDADEGTYTITFQGTAQASAEPEIGVLDPNDVVVADGGTYSVTNTGTAMFNSAWIVRNEGAAALNLTGTTAVAISGTPTNCTVTINQPASTTLAAASGGAATEEAFSFDITPTAAGAFSFTFVIASNDTDEPTYTITFNGDTSTPSSGGGGGGGDDDGGCSTGGDAPYSWMIVLGLLSLFALATRLRNSRA